MKRTAVGIGSLVTISVLSLIPVAHAGTATSKSLSAPVDMTPSSKPGLSAEELAKMAQNPVANLISVPFQWNLGFKAGPYDRATSALNIQPVVPFTLNEDWNVITRTIFPIVSYPAPTTNNSIAGIGDTTFTMFLSPAKSKGFVWGIGPAFSFPTASSPELGSGKWGVGPSLVGLYMGKQIVAGALINNIWSFAGWGAEDTNTMTLQPFFNFNFPGGWYFTSSPIITANWFADSSRDVWTVPLGGGFGKIIHLGRLPVNLSAQAFVNAATPQFGADWSIRLQCQFLFPK